MKAKSIRMGLAITVVGLLCLIVAGRRLRPSIARVMPVTAPVSLGKTAVHSSTEPMAAALAPAAVAASLSGIASETIAARIDRINRDYDAMRLATLAENTAHGEAAGGTHAFIRQLELLERERRKDLAAVLSPRELEDLEMRESPAGRLVTRLLGASKASDEQRRAVFRLQHAFEVDFGGSRVWSPAEHVIREQARQQMQEKIRVVLGDPLFGSWLAGEGELHARAMALAVEHGASPRIADDLRRTRDDYSLKLLALRATPHLPRDQFNTARQRLAEEARAHAMAILGPVLYQKAPTELLSWLPQE